MAAGAWQFLAPGLERLIEGDIDFDLANNFRMVLVTASYTPDRENHAAWSDISANEVANGNGYTTHGKVLTVTVTRPGSPSDEVVIDCDDQSWTASTITAKYAVIVEDADQNGALAAGDIPIAYSDLDTGGGSVSTTNGTFAVNQSASGIATIKQTN